MSIQAANCKLIARAPELLQQVAELTKENADLLEAEFYTTWGRELGQDSTCEQCKF